jgi:hypothetical protein
MQWRGRCGLSAASRATRSSPSQPGSYKERAGQGKGSGSSPVSLVTGEGWRCGGVQSLMARLRWSSSVAEWSCSTGEARRVRRGSQIKGKPRVDEAHREGEKTTVVASIPACGASTAVSGGGWGYLWHKGWKGRVRGRWFGHKTLRGGARHRRVSTAVASSNLVTEREPTARGHRGSHARSIRSGEGVERSSPRDDVGSLLKLVEGEWVCPSPGLGATR